MSLVEEKIPAAYYCACYCSGKEQILPHRSN